jgi:hypothetical protein
MIATKLCRSPWKVMSSNPARSTAGRKAVRPHERKSGPPAGAVNTRASAVGSTRGRRIELDPLVGNCSSQALPQSERALRVVAADSPELRRVDAPLPHHRVGDSVERRRTKVGPGSRCDHHQQTLIFCASVSYLGLTSGPDMLTYLLANAPAQRSTNPYASALDSRSEASSEARRPWLTRKRSLVQIQYRPPALSLVRRALRLLRRLRCFHVVGLASQTASLTDQLDGHRTTHPWPSLRGSTPAEALCDRPSQ